MSDNVDFTTLLTNLLNSERHSLFNHIIEKCIPQWTTGPRNFQQVSWGYTMDGTNQFVAVPCGGGKTALFYVPIIIILYLIKHKVLFTVAGRPAPVSPIALVVSPLIELENSQVVTDTVHQS